MTLIIDLFEAMLAEADAGPPWLVLATALIGFAGVVITAVLGYMGIRYQARRANMAENEMELQAAAMDMSMFLGDWAEIHKSVEELMEASNIDRFLILRAWNGQLTPKWTTSIVQIRRGMQEPLTYQHFELDQDYVNRIRQTVVDRSVRYQVSKAEPSAIKRVYEMEGVTEAIWTHIESAPLAKDPESEACLYCSFATHEAPTMGQDNIISENTATKCELITQRLKGLARVFRELQEPVNA